MRDREFKDSAYGQLSRIGRALASPKRLELLDLLSQCPKTVEHLARQVGQSVAAASHHLQVLRAAQLVEASKEGQFVRYRLADREVSRFFVNLRSLGESRLAEIERVTRRFLEGRDAVESVSREALLERVRRREVIVLDVRPAEEFRAGHIPGAKSLPLTELKRRLAELPRDQQIVAYCRGPYCVMAVDAVAVLKGAGFDAVRWADGVAEWSARGMALEA
jgi:rhodanese-related sulfurtransferase